MEERKRFCQNYNLIKKKQKQKQKGLGRERDKNMKQIKIVDLNENRDNVTDLQCTVS